MWIDYFKKIKKRKMKRGGKKNLITSLQPQSQKPRCREKPNGEIYGYTSQEFSLLHTKEVVPNGCFYNCGL